MLDVKTKISPTRQKSKKKTAVTFGLVVVASIALFALSSLILNPKLSSVFDRARKNPPVAGGYAEGTLKISVWNTIKAYEGTNGCTDVTSTMITVLQEPNADGVWVENWSVKACGQDRNIKVRFAPNLTDKTAYSISN